MDKQKVICPIRKQKETTNKKTPQCIAKQTYCASPLLKTKTEFFKEIIIFYMKYFPEFVLHIQIILNIGFYESNLYL